MKPLFEVEYPHGRAGVDVAVVEHTINCHVLPWTHHHFLRDVAHRCKHTNTHTTIIYTKQEVRIKTIWQKNPKDTLSVEQTPDSFSFMQSSPCSLQKKENFWGKLKTWSVSELRVNHPPTSQAANQSVQRKTKEMWLICKTGEQLHKGQPTKLFHDSSLLRLRSCCN